MGWTVENYLKAVGEASALEIQAKTETTLEHVYGTLARLENEGKARVYATDQGRKAKVRTWGWVDGVDIDIVHRNK